MKKIVIACVMINLVGCTSLATSISGTFIGNIASDRVLKEMDKQEKQNGRQKTIYKSNKH
jgi:hypothetical protein